MIRQWPNCVGFPNTDINLCLVWVFLRGPVRFREVQKAVLWSTHVVLPLEPRNRSWLCYLNAQNVGGFCWLSNALPSCVGSVAHTRVVSHCVVSCRVVSCRGTELGEAQRREDAVTLDSTRRAPDLLLSPRLQPKPKQHRDPRERDYTANTLLARFWPRSRTFGDLRGMGVLSFG